MNAPEHLPPQACPPRPRPAVAAIIPCFNHGQFVADAVRSCLAQSDLPGAPDLRIIVVDDGSTDGHTSAACDACQNLPGAAGRTWVIHQNNTGLPGARNAGVRHPAAADAPFLLFLDADDYLEPTGLIDLLAAIQAEDAAGRGGDVSHAYGQQRMAELGAGTWRVPDWDPLLLMITNIHPPTALVRRSCFDAVGGYTESMNIGYEDWDFWLKMAERGWRGVRVQKPVYVWRRHSPETMINRAVARHDELFAAIMANHADLYRRLAPQVIARSNSLLRRADANWLDETGEAIPLRNLRNWIQELAGERDAARLERDASRRDADTLRAQVAALEAKPMLRLSRSVHRAVDALPRPVATMARGLLNAIKRVSAPGIPPGTPPLRGGS